MDEKKNKLSEAQIRATKKYEEEKVDSIRLRVPIGFKAKMQAHVDTLPQYASKGRAHHSVNAWLVDLIKKELKIENNRKN